MDSDHDSDDCEYEMTEERTNERRIEQQLDEFRTKWKKEIQQRTVYGHVIDDKHKEKQQQTIDNEEQAKHFFQRATDLERQGKLYDAIKYYRAAMQLVPDIEFRMARKGQSATTATTTTMELNNRQENLEEDLHNNEMSERNEDLIDSLQRVNLDDNELSTTCVKNFPQQATHISCLPSEVLIYIFRWVVSSDLDVRSLEQCARVCKGFYICARDPQLWKMICSKTWPGVYISKATYIRQGEQSLDSFYSPWHLVEYYRYIRFFPDGVVLIYTSADEPRTTVARLKLDIQFVLIVAKRITQRTQQMNNTQRRMGRDIPTSDMEQAMHMEFEMGDAGKKKHAQLIWTHYEIRFTNKRTGDERTTVLDVTNDRHPYPPLIFSRVKSYTLASEQPLK